MDTDDLSEMAYEVIIKAARVSGTLTAELGAMARQYRNENAWLGGVREHLEEILEDPEDYVSYWDLEDAEGVSATVIKDLATALFRHTDEILATPMEKRGERDD